MIHLQKMESKSVDDMRIANKGHPLGRFGKVGVNMPMDKIAGLESADEFQEALETPMTTIFGIMDMPGRRVGNHQVHPPL
jgi:hypothetical protein